MSRQSGERNSQAELTEKDVRAIRLLYSKGVYTQPEIAKLYGRSKELISKICARKLWAQVK